jgi:hypothetical protein
LDDLESAVDVIVVGAGAAGMTAAVVAAAKGLSVLLLEHAERVGGTTAVSGGMVWIPGNHKSGEAGAPDTLDAARDYLRQTVPGMESDARMDAYLARGDEAVRFLEVNTAVRLRPVKRYPDYYPDLPGATQGGRVLEPVPMDARALGRDFGLLRDPLPEFMLFGGMMISREDLPHLRRVGRSPGAAWHVAKLLLRHFRERLGAHRGTSLVLGNALAARLLKSVRDHGVQMRLGASVAGLVERHGRVVGVEVLDAAGRARRVEARRGVVLATGGLSHDATLRRAFVPAAAGTLSATVASGARAGGARLATAVGATLGAVPWTATEDAGDDVDRALAFWVPVSTFRRPDGTLAMFPHTVTDRAKPGLIAVDGEGRRFVNEARSYHEFVRAQLRRPDTAIPAWLVCDSRFLWKYGLGKVRPFAWSTRRERDEGYLKRGATLADLAREIGVPPERFVATVQAFNREAAQGRDPEFGRGGDSYQRHLGDAEHPPNPCVAPLQRGPFHAVKVLPADLGMSAGIRTDERARVLDAAGCPIPGLYACGNDAHSVMNGSYPGPGITLGPALVFGYLAACDLAESRR